MINAKIVSSWAMAAALQGANHDVYWFDNGWYHSLDCPECARIRPTPVTVDGVGLSDTEASVDSDCIATEL